MTAAASSRTSHSEPHRIGRFSIAHELGRGTTGCVYLGHDTTVGRDVAIKTVNPRLSGSDKSRCERQLINEARIAGRLSHPNIVTIYDASSEGGITYVAMEYLQGHTLARLLDNGRRFPPHEAASVAWRIAGALEHAHRRGVVHRDLKPANIYMVNDLQPKLIDFGIARGPNRLPEDEARPDEVVTLLAGSDQLFGTPNYMSPEQARGEPVDARTDIYSLGAVMYEMLTGSRPFQAQSADKLLQQIAYKAPPAPHEINPEVPGTLSRIVMQAMSKRPEKRYQSAERMALDLRRYLLKERRARRRLHLAVDAAMQAAERDDEVRSPRRARWLLAAIACVLSLAAAGIVLLR